jgi:acylphosphatase
MPSETKKHLFISGLVQGVFLRAGMRDRAEELGLTGWAMNLPDGRVEAVLEGEEEKMKEMLTWLKNDSSPSRVDKIEVETEEYQGEFDDFEIRY